MQNVVHGSACDAVRDEAQEVSKGHTATCNNFEAGQRQSLNSLHSNYMADLSESDEDEASEAESFILDPGDLDDEPVIDTSKFLLPSEGVDSPELQSVDPDTQARLEALLEATGLSRLSLEGKQFADPEVLRRLTTSVSCALDEAAAALTRMRAEHAPSQIQSSSTRSLAEACSDGDIRAVRQLLDEGRNVNEITEEGESLLSLACASGYFELAQLLLAMHANVEDRGLKDTTPLMEASSAGHVEIVKLLIDHRAEVNAQTAQGNTPLMFACAGGHEEVAQVLLEAGANVEDHNENGHTPLMEAASAGHVRVAQVLVQHGASINTHSNEFKESALTLACYKGHLEMVRFLLEAGADQEHKTDEMHTALMEASMDGHVEVARLLLDSGAQVNMPADSFESPLTLAACGGHVELAMLLLERGANIEEVNDEGYTPLMEAAREGHEEMVALLLSQGADINAQTEETQETALTLACCGGFLEVTDFLIKAGADLELGASTPLMEAAQEGHLELVRYLIGAGANVNAKTATGDTALTYACENGHTDVADLLLQANADLEHESEGGRTPLMKAARAGHLCTVQFLMSKGANVNKQTTSNDHTPLSLACAGGHLAVVELLLAQGADPTHKLKDNSTMLIEAAKGGHTTVVQLLLDYPNNLNNLLTSSNALPDLTPMTSPHLNSIEASRLASHNLQVVSLPEDQRAGAVAVAATHPYLPQVQTVSRVPEPVKEGDSQVVAKVTQKVCNQRKVDSPSRHSKGDELRPSERLEACINNMMRKAELLHPSREEQILQKQQILEELQRVERELQEKAQAQILLSAHHQHHHQHHFPPAPAASAFLDVGPLSLGLKAPPVYTTTEPTKGPPSRQTSSSSCEEVEKLNLRNNALSEVDIPPSNSNTVQSLPVQQDSKRHSDKVKLGKSNKASKTHHATTTATSTTPSTPRTQIDSCSYSSNLPMDTSSANVLALSGVGTTPFPVTLATFPTTVTMPSCSTSFATLPTDDGLMVAAPARTLHETLGDIVTGPATQLAGTSQVAITQQVATAASSCLEPCLVAPSSSLPLTFHTFPGTVPSHQTFAAVDLDSQTDSNHDTALTLACAGGHEELVNLLLTRGADIEHRDKKGFTPLMLAATAGHAGVVDILLNHGAEIEAQSERTKDTALSLACSGGRYEVVEILLTRGANKEHRNVSDYTPLSLAASGGYVNIIKLLLHNGAEINSRTGSKLGISPLMLAAMNGHTAAVKLLLDMGSDINAQIETNRNTALTLACFQGRHEVVALLLDRKANVEHRAKTGLTPLMEAASGGYVEVGKVLLDKGADVNAPPVPSSRDTALTIAADKGHYRFVELLLERGAAVDVKNKKGNSPLWLACNGGHLDVVQLLVNAKADIDSQDNRRVSCLMAAFRKGHVKVVKWMVKHVSQFPSDQEMTRYIATVNDKELLKKCNQCMEIIHAAKERQAAEANKYATILLEELDMEKSREESRRAAAARRRERKRRKKKEKQEQLRAAKLAAADKGHVNCLDKDLKGDKQALSSQSEEDDDDDDDDDDEEDERLENPSGVGHNPCTVNNQRNSSCISSSNKCVNNGNISPSGPKGRLKIDANEGSNESPQKAVQQEKSYRKKKQQLQQQQAEKEKAAMKAETSRSSNSRIKDTKGKVPEKQAESNRKRAGRNEDEPAVSIASTRTTTTVSVSTRSSTTVTVSSPMSDIRHTNTSVHRSRETGVKRETLVNGSAIGDLDDFGTLPGKGGKHRSNLENNKINALNSLALEMPDNTVATVCLRSPTTIQLKSPLTSTSPKKGVKREDGWKEVVRRQVLSKKVSVPSTAISRVIGRGGCNINTIREVSGAHIEVEKQKGQGERTVIIRGSAEATRQAQLLITGLVRESDKELTDLMAQLGVNKVQSPIDSLKSVIISTYSSASSNQVTPVLISGSSSKTSIPRQTQVSTRSVCSTKPTPISAPSLPPFSQTRPSPRPGIPVSTVAAPPFSSTSGWGSSAKVVTAPTTVQSSVSTASVTTAMNISSVNQDVARSTQSGTSTLTKSTVSYTMAVISPAKSTGTVSSGVAADTRPSPSGPPSSNSSPSPGSGESPALPMVASTTTTTSTPSTSQGSIPQEYSPFNNLFSKVAQPCVWGQKDKDPPKPNFASVAASGVISVASTSQSTTPTQSSLSLLLTANSEPELIVDAAKAPGYRGNLHVSPPVSVPTQQPAGSFGPIGSGPRSAPCTPPIAPILPTGSLPTSFAMVDLPPNPPTPPVLSSSSQDYFSAPPESRMPQMYTNMVASRYQGPTQTSTTYSQPPTSMNPPEPTPPQPTIQSNLNPNAPDFSSRTPLIMPFTGIPRIPFPPGQDFLHPLYPHPGLPMVPPAMPHQYSGMVGVQQNAPTITPPSKDEGSPVPSSVSPQAGNLSPSSNLGMGNPDDRKLPRPIGTERAQKKNPVCGNPPPAATRIWSYSNSGAVSSELGTTANWVQYSHNAPQGDGLPTLLPNRFSETLASEPTPAMEHPYHQLNSSLSGSGCPPFLNGFPPQLMAAHLYSGGHSEGPAGETWPPQKVPLSSLSDAIQPPTGSKMPWQGWAHHQT